MSLIDLRSDTVTHPTPEMRAAMAEAKVGDDGRERDPTTRRLERLAADMLGKEDSLFLVSGTASNTLAMMSVVRGIGCVLAHEKAHILLSEMGALNTVAGLQHKTVPGPRGAMDIAALRSAIQPRLQPGKLPTVLIEVETTHNHAGGCALPLAHLAEVRAVADEFGIPVHMDGARIFNAAVALGVPVRDIAQYADTVSFCLSKGLSAPVGSLIVGPAEVLARAHPLRRMLGGTLRQSGVIAAPGIVALETMVDRLAEDHANAKRLATALHALDPTLVDPAEVETNIVMVDLGRSGRDAAWFAAELEGEGVWAGANPSTVMRLVTHRHIGTAEVDSAAAAFAAVWKRAAA